MAVLRIGILLLALWLIQLILFPYIPLLRFLLDPLFLFFCYWALQRTPARWLWMMGLFLGLLKDASAGTLFGAWACSFALTGWVIAQVRYLVERDDPLIVGIWVGLLSGFVTALHALWVNLSDPALHWTFSSAWAMGVLAISQGALAVYGFPRVRKVLDARPVR